MEVREPVIVDVVRTAFGKRNGALRNWHPTDLLAFCLNGLIERTGVDPERVDDVVGGCITQAGEQGCNVTRNAWVAAGLPWHVPATSIDRQCGSSQQAMHFVAASVMAGVYDLAIACGVESMTRAPMASNAKGGTGPFSQDFLRVIASRETAEQLGLPVRARILHMAVGAEDPVLVLSAPNPVTRKLLARSGMAIDDFDAMECNEAFAAIALMWAREFLPDRDRYNARGGAIAIGHPLGASGARITTTLLNHLDS